MIQELLGGTAAFIGAERKISTSGVLEASPSASTSPSLSHSPSPSPSPSPCSSTSCTTPASATAPTNISENQNLRCPRCDSSNTKFCYYNNYNLTQPRHFCKTCRRYWTKGGALRNVPIGGGCRKNKTTTVTTKVGKASAAKVKTLPADIAKPGSVGGYDHTLPSNPVLWASPQNSQLLALLRSTQNHYLNPSASPMNNSINLKEEAVLIGPHMALSDPASVLDGRTLGLDTVSQVPSIGLCSPFLRNNQQQTQQHHQLNQHQQQNGLLLSEVQNSGIQELYQRLRSSANYYPDHAPLILGTLAPTTSSISTILESAPASGGESGFWNPTLSWPDLQATNGAYP